MEILNNHMYRINTSNHLSKTHASLKVCKVFWKKKYNDGLNSTVPTLSNFISYEMVNKQCSTTLYKYAMPMWVSWWNVRGETFHQDTHTGMVYLIYYTEQTPFWWNININVYNVKVTDDWYLHIPHWASLVTTVDMKPISGHDGMANLC